MAKKKDNRITEGRATETRQVDERVLMNMAYSDPLYIDPKIIPDDVDYYWVRESYLGQPDTSRMVDMRRKGWEPVPAERHPELVFADFFGKATHTNGFISQKGLVLCDRPKHYGKIEKDQIDKRNYEILCSMPGTENFLGDASIPAQFTGDTYTSKGASFGK
jgi:hypothetical protein